MSIEWILCARHNKYFYRTIDKLLILFNICLFFLKIEHCFYAIFLLSFLLNLYLAHAPLHFLNFQIFFSFSFLNIKLLHLTWWKWIFLVENFLRWRANSEHVNNFYTRLNDRRSLKTFRFVSMKTWSRARILNGQWLLPQNAVDISYLKLNTTHFIRVNCYSQRKTKTFPSDRKKIIFNNYRKKNYNRFLYFYITLLQK